MINRRLTSSEAAERLGVKTATLYAYVSRGLLHPERAPSGSTFDLQEVVQLSRSARHPGGPGSSRRGPVRRTGAAEPSPADPIFVTELTLIDGGRLYYRGLDAVELSRTRSFEEVAEWLWTSRWEGEDRTWTVAPVVEAALSRVLERIPARALPTERYMAAVVAASLCDELRHDLNPGGVAVTGRALLAALVRSLPHSKIRSGKGTIAARAWRGLAGRPGPAPGVAVIDAALVLAADHELAPSTLAARVAASFRADPYAVVLTGLGPASGSWYAGSTGAPGEVEALLRDADEIGVERAIGDRLRRAGEIPHGFGMPLYPQGDPRGAALLERLEGVGPVARLDLVRQVLEVGRARGFPPPNFDMGLGALSFCAEMGPGSAQAIFTLGKVAGWLAHAIEEYTSPTRFRSRADYVGPRPEARPAP